MAVVRRGEGALDEGQGVFFEVQGRPPPPAAVGRRGEGALDKIWEKREGPPPPVAVGQRGGGPHWMHLSLLHIINQIGPRHQVDACAITIYEAPRTEHPIAL